MKIKTKIKSYEEVLAMDRPKHKKVKRPNIFFRTLLKIITTPDLVMTRFKCNKIGMEKLDKKEPCLILMNHSSFIDLEIAMNVMYPRPINIVTTTDGFVGKNWIMTAIGCIPTKKFIFDLSLVKDIMYTVRTLKSSVLMYPEASYSFDGTATPLPETLAKFVTTLGVPVIMIRTYGAFARDPLYNHLRKRKTRVYADMIYLLSPDDLKSKSEAEIRAIIEAQFDFNSFRWQYENNIMIKEPFRAEGLDKPLYKCPHCNSEGAMTSSGIRLWCKKCGVTYELTEYGKLKSTNADTVFEWVSDWYSWERECVKQEIYDGSYVLDADVDICMMIDTKCVYRIGVGTLTHTNDGFHLVGCNGKLNYAQKPIASYSLYSDFYWYEIGDVICIGNSKALYYCFPKNPGVPVAKARLATEELYKKIKSEKREKVTN